MKTESLLDYGISVSRVFFKYYYYIYILLLVLVLVTLSDVSYMTSVMCAMLQAIATASLLTTTTLISVVGGLVFQIVESPPEAKIIDAIMRQRDSTIRQLRVKIQAGENKGEVTLFIQLYEGQYIGAIRNGTVILDGKQDPLWTFEGSVYYCVTTFSLVGYGNLAPRTNLGRAIAIIYCGFTIPVSSLILAELGEMLLLAFEYVWKTFYARKPKEQKALSMAQEMMNTNNANKNTSTNYQVTIRCSRYTTEAISHNSVTNILRYFSANSDSCTIQDTPNLIRCGPSQRATDLILGASPRNDPEDALSDYHGNNHEDIVADFQMNNSICVMENSPVTAGQDALSDSTGNNPDDIAVDFDMNYPICDFENSPVTAAQDAQWGLVMDGCVETSDIMQGNFSVDVCDNAVRGFAAVNSSDVSVCSYMNDPIHTPLGFPMNERYCCPDDYSGNDLKDAWGDNAITESETTTCGSWMIVSHVALREFSVSALDNTLGGSSVKGPHDILCGSKLRESEETKDGSAIHSFDYAVCGSTIDTSVDDLPDSTIDALINDLGDSSTNAPANYLGDYTNDAHKDKLSYSSTDAREDNPADSTTDAREDDLYNSTVEASVDVLRAYICEASVDVIRDSICEASVDVLRDSICEATVDVLHDYICEASVDVLRAYICEASVDVLRAYICEASVDDMYDSTTDADVDGLDDVFVNNEETLDQYNFILNIPLYCLSRFHMQAFTQGQLKRGQRLNSSVCLNFSRPALGVVAKKCDTRNQENTMSISCRCLDISIHCVVADRTLSGCEEFTTNNSDMPSNGDMSVKNSQNTREADITRCGSVADITRYGSVADITRYGSVADIAKYGSVADITRYGSVADITRYGSVADITRRGSEADITRYGSEAECELAVRTQVAGLIQVLEWTPDEELGRVRASPAVTTLSSRSTLILKSQAHSPVSDVSLVGRWSLSRIHHMQPASRMSLVEVQAIGANDRNDASGKCRVSSQPYLMGTLLVQIRLSTVTEQSHGEIKSRLALVKLCCLTEDDSMLIKTAITPHNSCNMSAQMSAHTKRGTYLPQYGPRIDTADKDKLLASVAQHSPGQHYIFWAKSGVFDCRCSQMLSVCHIILFPKRNTPKRIKLRASYLQNSVLVLANNQHLTALPRLADTPQSATFETMDICPRCLLYVNLDCLRKITRRRAQSRGCHHRLEETSTEEPNGECENISRTTSLLAKTLQSAHLQWRCYMNKLVSCNKLPRKASRTRTKIRQVIGTDKSKASLKPCPGVFSSVKAVAKLVLTREVRMPNSVAMFWLGTPLRCLYIGRCIGQAIHRHFRDAQVQNSSPNRSSVTESMGQASKYNHKTRDTNNNVISKDDDDDDNDDDDDDDDEDDDEDDYDDDDDDDNDLDGDEFMTTRVQTVESKITSEPVLLTIATTFIFISLGSSFLTKFTGNMTYFDSYWFIWISVATIGYGDIVPTDQKLFLGILAYLFIGLCLMSNLISETSLFFSANVSKARAITSDAVAIINTQKQLILIQERAATANRHWAILRERVLNKKIPRHLVDESIKYRAGLLAEEREMVRWAYKLYFKQDRKPESIFQSSGDGFEPPVEPVIDEGDLSELQPIEELETAQPEPTVKPKQKTGILQTIKRVAVNGYRRVKNKVKRKTPEGSSTQIIDPNLYLETGQGLPPERTSIPPVDAQVAPPSEPTQSY